MPSCRMRPLAAALLTSTMLVSTVSASTWTLRTTSLLAEGCFEMCACPIWADELSGSFEMIASGTDGSFEVFAVTKVDWTGNAHGVSIHGSGSYRLDRKAGLQRLELDLRRDGDVVEHFDSGLVAVTAAFPEIRVVAAIEGAPACYDVRTAVLALPEDIVSLQTTTWTALKVLYTLP